MLVIACDEGVMPQTIEHLDVLRCLRIAEGVIVLTKADKSPDLIPAVADEARELARGTFLADKKIIPVSSVTGEGIPALKEELARIAARVQARSAEGIFRLPIDRVFTLKGAGTVVTGTVLSGSLKAGESVACLPQNRILRARALQVHNEAEGEISAGQRAAINLADVSKEDLERGNVLASPNALAPTLMADARLELSLRLKKPLEQRARVRIHHGTSELMARVVLLDRDSLKPGESALVQLRLESPLVAAAGDPFVVRSYSPMFVIGGGGVVDPHPPKRRKSAGVDDVAKRESSPVAEVLLDALDRAGARGMDFARLKVHGGISDEALRSALEEMKNSGLVADGRRDFWFSAGALREMQSAITARLAKLHAAEPLRPFAALNQVSAGAAPAPDARECFRLALDALRERGEVISTGERLRLASHRPQWVGRFAAAREKLLAEARVSFCLADPTGAESLAQVGLAEADCRRALDALAEAGELILLAPGVYIHPESFSRARDQVREFLARNGRMNIAQARDLLGASRKYLLPFLEELDRQRVTAREGDFRVAARTQTS
jgi:selenocysteine-specific elongation factor